VIVNNTTIINQTVNITNVRVVNKTVINEGPRPEVIERESGRRVQAIPVHEFRHRQETTVAARERNIPTATGRKVQSPARIGPSPAPTQAVLPRNAHVAEKPAEVVTQPAQPLPKPARTSPQRPEMGRPARDANRNEIENARRITTVPPRVEPQVNLAVKPVQAVPPRRDARPVEQPTVVAKPMPKPSTIKPVRDEMQRETVVERRNIVAPPAVEPRPRYEAKPATDRAPQPPGRAQAAPPAAVRKQAAPPAGQSADMRLISPKEKSRAAERDQAYKTKKEDKGAKKKGEDQVTPLPEVPTRQPR